MIAILLIAALASSPDEAQLLLLDHVESYAAPAAFRVEPVSGEEGTIVFDVEVKEDGSVAHWDVVSETSMARVAAVEALEKWRFVVDRGERPHPRRVTFIFEAPRETECDHTLAVRYESPMTLHIQPAKARGVCLPRVDGKVAPKECEVHHVAMNVERLPIHATGPPLPPSQDVAVATREAELVSHRATDFPNAWHYASSGCIVAPEQYAEVYICPKCREAEDAWLKAHPGFVP